MDGRTDDWWMRLRKKTREYEKRERKRERSLTRASHDATPTGSVSTASLTHASRTHTRANLYLIIDEDVSRLTAAVLAPRDSTTTTTQYNVCMYMYWSTHTSYLALLFFIFCHSPLEKENSTRMKYDVARCTPRFQPRDVDSSAIHFIG